MKQSRLNIAHRTVGLLPMYPENKRCVKSQYSNKIKGLNIYVCASFYVQEQLIQWDYE